MPRRSRQRSGQSRSISIVPLVCGLCLCGVVLALSACETDNASSGSAGSTANSRRATTTGTTAKGTSGPAVVVSDLGAHNGTPVPALATGDAAGGNAQAGATNGVGPERPSTSPVLARYERTNGLVIEDLKLGGGSVCIPGATITFRHRAFLPSGTQWEESYTQSPAPTFSISRGMVGWKQGLPGMRVGGVRRLIIPPDLGFGVTGRRAGADGQTHGQPVDEQGWIVPPGTTLIYEIELLDTKVPNFVPAPPQPTPAPRAAAKPSADTDDMNK